jgi:hypothetical protein
MEEEDREWVIWGDIAVAILPFVERVLGFRCGEG